MKISAKAKLKTKKSTNKKTTFTETARKKQILDVSMTLFREKGYANTSIANIADLAGISRGVVFYYFDGKKELGEEVIRQNLKNYGLFVQNRLLNKYTAVEKLLEYIDACLDYTAEHKKDWIVVVDTLGHIENNTQKSSLLTWISERTQKQLSLLIVEGQESGEIEKFPAKELSWIIQAVVDGLMSLVAVQPDDLDIHSCKKVLKNILLKIFKPE